MYLYEFDVKMSGIFKQKEPTNKNEQTNKQKAGSFSGKEQFLEKHKGVAKDWEMFQRSKP